MYSSHLCSHVSLVVKTLAGSQFHWKRAPGLAPGLAGTCALVLAACTSMGPFGLHFSWSSSDLLYQPATPSLPLLLICFSPACLRLLPLPAPHGTAFAASAPRHVGQTPTATTAIPAAGAVLSRGFIFLWCLDPRRSLALLTAFPCCQLPRVSAAFAPAITAFAPLPLTRWPHGQWDHMANDILETAQYCLFSLSLFFP